MNAPKIRRRFRPIGAPLPVVSSVGTATHWLGRRLGYPVVAGLVSLGCGTRQPTVAQSPVPKPVVAKIAQPCPELANPTGPLDLNRSRLYVEVAQLAPQAAATLPSSGAAVISVMSFVANPSVPTTMPWGRCLDEACDQRDARITLTATIDPDPTQPASVHFVVERLPDGVDSPPLHAPQTVEWQTRFEANLRLGNQQPQQLIDPENAVAATTTYVTSYLLTQPEDLFVVMACKAEQVGTDEIRPVADRPDSVE